MPQGNTLKVSQKPQRLTDTQPMESSNGFTSVNPNDNRLLTATDKYNSIEVLDFPIIITINPANSVSAKQFNNKESTGPMNQAMMQTTSTKEFSKTNTQKYIYICRLAFHYSSFSAVSSLRRLAHSYPSSVQVKKHLLVLLICIHSKLEVRPIE